jgi:hypothetical protein
LGWSKTKKGRKKKKKATEERETGEKESPRSFSAGHPKQFHLKGSIRAKKKKKVAACLSVSTNRHCTALTISANVGPHPQPHLLHLHKLPASQPASQAVTDESNKRLLV